MVTGHLEKPGLSNNNLEKSILKNLRVLLQARSSSVSLGTVSKDGELDIAPVGSVDIRDDGTITLLKGPRSLNSSYKNLKATEDGVIMVVTNSLAKWCKFFFGIFDEPAGYRIHVKLKEEREFSHDDLQPFKKKFGIFTKTKGWQKIEKSLSKLMVFEVGEIREIRLPK